MPSVRLRPDWRELDDDLLRKAKLYVESREAASRESGDVIAAGTIFAEIGEVIAGNKAGRESAEEITLFKSVGVAVEDLASAEFVYRESSGRPITSCGGRIANATAERWR